MFHDIKQVTSEKDASYFVDTNVWYWCTYAASKSFLAKTPQKYQVDYYPSFVENALENNSTLYCSPLTLVELANLIERSEWEIYKAYTQDSTINLKAFRKKPTERKAVLNEIKIAWQSVKELATELPFNIDSETSDTFIQSLSSYKVDGYDALFHQIMNENEIGNIITDDKDFRSIDDIDVFGCYR
jgi:predicted nucleic acid-binding protein